MEIPECYRPLLPWVPALSSTGLIWVISMCTGWLSLDGKPASVYSRRIMSKVNTHWSGIFFKTIQWANGHNPDNKETWIDIDNTLIRRFRSGSMSNPRQSQCLCYLGTHRNCRQYLHLQISWQPFADFTIKINTHRVEWEAYLRSYTVVCKARLILSQPVLSVQSELTHRGRNKIEYILQTTLGETNKSYNCWYHAHRLNIWISIRFVVSQSDYSSLRHKLNELISILKGTAFQVTLVVQIVENPTKTSWQYPMTRIDSI